MAKASRIVFVDYDCEALVKAREDKGLSLRAVASELGVSYTHLCKVENSTLTPSAEFVEKLCRFYGLDPRVILRQSSDSPPVVA